MAVDDEQKQKKKQMITWAIIILVIILLCIGAYMMYGQNGQVGMPASPDIGTPQYRFKFY